MNLHRLIFQNNSLKFILSFLLILFFCFNTQSEIPEKYKIESSLKKCKGSDYKKWTNCYGEYKFPRMEYKGEWQNGMLNGLGVLKEAYGGIYVGEFKDQKYHGKGKLTYSDGKTEEGKFVNGFCIDQNAILGTGYEKEEQKVESTIQPKEFTTISPLQSPV